ncbi:MAG: sulfoxide reductase heme-binding subunit YedZ [Betaproteobacteria bacterium]|uniref:sulfite oxidase heme-binding subunit YedZ n=1 Tax=Ferrovum sp. PN-J185 TaxID=1356306 RepID=UPI00079B659C|nr:protein-methionine-sulfoxide reductase heme-binding subunit MsrQ [Ferrovum sp. PN-J185]KXW56814.1 sulfoxide reductase heme-binding subunit YedZ [Ferrovum sp. PN-J185]MDE1891381.1 sulfoxide reductase heme-binding subunit YedZ [Betaproteobacteria bacterium]MDE2056093.1 sulfoxide reductase heme-binding subunit YedZ [Betaproteobacteria bacterium]
MKKIVFALSSLPLIYLSYQLVFNLLGPNPVSEVIHFTGAWSLRFFLITLCITPIKNILNLAQLVKYRRMLGLFAFFYLSLHFLSYSGLDLHFSWQDISHDLIKHPFVYVGFIGLVLTLPLALTSNQYAQKKLKKNWKKLHQLAYVIPVLGVVHFWWLVKRDLTEPILYATILMILLGYRLIKYLSLQFVKKSQWEKLQES